MKKISVAFGLVFKNPRYGITAFILACGIFVTASLLPNMSLVFDILVSNISFLEKTKFLISAGFSISSSAGLLSATTTLIIAALFGIMMSMIAYHLKQRSKKGILQTASLGIGSLFSGTLGIGCAACGSLVGSALLPFIGTSGALSLLPFGGAEFNMLGITLLLVSLVLISRAITSSPTCILKK